jgi:hypothetical protein
MILITTLIIMFDSGGVFDHNRLKQKCVAFCIVAYKVMQLTTCGYCLGGLLL